MSQSTVDVFLSLAERAGFNEEETRAARELILLNPDLLITQYKDSSSLSEEAERYQKEGNSLVAGNRYASATKLALYEGDPKAAMKFLDKCIATNETDNSTYKLAAKNFEKVSQFALDFYKTKLGGSS